MQNNHNNLNTVIKFNTWSFMHHAVCFLNLTAGVKYYEDKNYYSNLYRPSLWFEVKNLCFQTTSELDTAKYKGIKRREKKMCDEMTKKPEKMIEHGVSCN